MQNLRQEQTNPGKSKIMSRLMSSYAKYVMSLYSACQFLLMSYLQSIYMFESMLHYEGVASRGIHNIVAVHQSVFGLPLCVMHRPLCIGPSTRLLFSPIVLQCSGVVSEYNNSGVMLGSAYCTLHSIPCSLHSYPSGEISRAP